MTIILSWFLRIALLAMLAVPAFAAPDVLDPEEAFRVTATLADDHTVAVSARIAPGYALYRERFGFSATGAALGAPQFPPGLRKYDPAQNGDVEVYHDRVTIRVPVQAAGPFTLAVRSQGCADAGLCYLPQETTFALQAAAAPDRVKRALAGGKPVLLDFYADWCVACREMEAKTFSEPAVRAQLAGVRLLRADVTAAGPAERALLKRFGLFGPPAVLLFDGRGHEIVDARVIGFQDAPAFLRTLATFEPTRTTP
jgi:thiol:disulfide interchange protein DsbD